jgi:hypothetical protein
MFTAIPLVSDRAWLSFISSLESCGNSFGFGLFEYFYYRRVNAFFVGHFHSFTMRY